MMKGALGKVTALITRRIDIIPQLLVFRHPTAGIQLPAGTVDLDEPFEKALLREVFEETGLTQVAIEKFLGEYKVRTTQPSFLRSSTLCKSPCLRSEAYGPLLNRGRRCHILETCGSYSLVRIEDGVGSMEADTAGAAKYEGWVLSQNLTDTVVRRFYHVSCSTDTRMSWFKRADLNHIFKCYWTALIPKPKIHPAQQDWIDSNYSEVLSHYEIQDHLDA